MRYSRSSALATTPAYKLADYTLRQAQDIAFTGQYSYMDDLSTPATEGFGLMFYREASLWDNARFYDPALGRFTSADTIIPGGVQGLDRYAYVNNSPISYVDPSGHMAENDDDSGIGSTDKPGCGVSGGGAYGFHCTKEDLDGSNLQQRLDWFNWLTQNMNENIGAGTSDWFTNIKTVIAGFNASGQDDNEWVLNVDANILLAVQNGYAASIGHYSGPSFASDDSESGAGLWQNFFTALGEPVVSADTLIQYWGDAEQASTDEGLAGTSAQQGVDDKIFTGIGNIYRGISDSGWCQINFRKTCAGGFYDPRTAGFGLSPVILPMAPIYYLDTIGLMITGH